LERQILATMSRSGAVRLAGALLLLALAVMPFFALTRVQFDAPGFHPLNQREHSTNKHRDVLRPVSCQKYRRDSSIYDANRNLTLDQTKRLTITDPPFYISLHAMWFDKKRWVHIMKQGEYYEKGITALFHRVLSAYDITALPRPLVLDIGMNIGWFSLYSRAMGHDVVAFEPNPTMFLRVCESLKHNQWSQGEERGGVTLWNYGLGATPGVFNLTLGNNPGGSSFHEDRLAPKFRRTLPVTVVTLDRLAAQEGWLDRTISLVKIDVEGFENFVFEGGTTLFHNGNVENIIMENSITNMTIVAGMFDMLYDAGYRIMEILSVEGDPYHEDWWHTFNPALELRHTSKEPLESEQMNFLSRATSNIWWQHQRLGAKAEGKGNERVESFLESTI